MLCLVVGDGQTEANWRGGSVVVSNGKSMSGRGGDRATNGGRGGRAPVAQFFGGRSSGRGGGGRSVIAGSGGRGFIPRREPKGR